MAVIFDLDQTLVDSQVFELLRKKRDWATIKSRVSEVKVYEKIGEVIKLLNDNNIRVAIVTRAPRPYCEKIINHFGWKIDVTVCYHDCPTNQQKPHPAPMIKAINALGVEPEKIISIGDSDTDIQSGKAAGIYSIGSLWGTLTKESLLAAKPDLAINTVDELILLIKKRYSI